ncbi:metallophosphoesterase [Polyangium sp. 6x1]|uniref:metallophosphoesterase n=1 Tax=Polyangium sp. 6x1 TaxID=3042689 RepID=UPI002482CAA1|nr:metallophosphoesterase [Polyangium sp. 6x1]MDI1447877.1 metallophosphoesterase [Polyangium sp. 6x1]
MGRTVVVGDLHGCRDELEDLLGHVGFGAGDRLISVGDLVVRGPDPAGTIDLLRKHHARVVRGNHEDRLLRYRQAPPNAVPQLGSLQREVVRALRRRHWDFLASLPLWIDLPEHGLRVVHAGVDPTVPIERQSPRTLMYVRSLNVSGAPEERRGSILWGERYVGPPHLVFGHNALERPQIHRDATGIDTGCVYGGRLTAMVLRAGEHPPPPEDRWSVLVSVPARRTYYPR